MAVETTANLRLLKAVVIILGVAILVAIGVIIVTIVERAGNLAADPEPVPATGQAAPAAFGERHLAVPDGDRVVAMTADGDRLVLRLERPDGGTYLLVVDLRTGARLGTIRLGPE